MSSTPSDRFPRWSAPDQALADLHGPSTEVRADQVARVRREIAAGTYETPEKWEAAFDRLVAAAR